MLETIACLTKAIEVYTDMGRFNIAAKHHENIAVIYENDVGDLQKSMEHYEQATDYFKVKNPPTNASSDLLQMLFFLLLPG